MGYKGSRTNIDSVVPLRREYIVVAARSESEKKLESFKSC